MASGWWRSTHANLALGSPVDFAVTTVPAAPRGYPKLASIATGAGHFLGGTPSVVISDVIYYAADSYTQDTDNPYVSRFDGRASSKLFEIPALSGVPAKAILSLASNPSGDIFVSTWDSGTNSSTFAGRVFVWSGGTLTRIDESLFTGGKLPYALVWFNNTIYVGVSKQDPASTAEVVKINYAVTRSGGPNPTCTLTGTTYKYRIGCENSSNSAIGMSNEVSVVNSSTLNSTNYNSLSWTTTGLGTDSTYDVLRMLPDNIQIVNNRSATLPRTIDDTGLTDAGGGPPVGPVNITLTVTVVPAQATTNTYRIGAIVDGVEYLGSAINVSNCPATLLSTFYVAISWAAVSGASSYRVYRTAGHTSTGLITTTTSTSLNDTGLAASGSVPSISSSIALTSGAVGCLTTYGSNLYVGSYQPAGTFGKVFKIDTSDNLTTSDTVAPGGTAQAYNGFTAGIDFESNLYMSYWNDDATDLTLIRKFDGSSWTTVSTISGAGARPIVVFAAADGVAYAYGGGDAKTGILYSSPTGATWTDKTSLLPTAVEAIPFIGTVNVIGGF